MKTLLDTHAFIWLATDQARLSKPARDVIRRSEEGLYISAVAAWEIGLLVNRGRFELDIDPAVLLATACRKHGIEEIPLRGEDALRSTLLPALHRDPFDRILVALAIQEGLVLVSKDEQLARYPGVKVVW